MGRDDSAPANTDSGSSLLGQLAHVAGPEAVVALIAARRPKLHRNLMLGLTAYSVGSQAYTWWRSRQGRSNDQAFTVTVTENDELYGLVQRWLYDESDRAETESLIAVTERTYDDDLGEWEWDLTYQVNSKESREITLDGHRIAVRVGFAADDDSQQVDGPQARSRQSKLTPRVVRLIAFSVEGRAAVQRKLDELLDARKTEKTGPSFYAMSRWGDWTAVPSDRAARDLESVVLRDGVRETLVDDLERFLEQEQLYARWSMPWHRGYLLYGPPGTGKTSICAALSSHFGLDIYYLTLSHIESDSALNSVMRNIKERSIVVIEDIDVLRASHDRASGGDPTTQGVTLAGLINALDGLVTPHGMITIMTTNNLETLDPALVRNGRVDTKIEIEVLDDDQLRRLVEYYVGPGYPMPSIEGFKITAADAMNELKKHFDDPPAGAAALRRYLIERRAERLTAL